MQFVTFRFRAHSYCYCPSILGDPGADFSGWEEDKMGHRVNFCAHQSKGFLLSQLSAPRSPWMLKCVPYAICELIQKFEGISLCRIYRDENITCIVENNLHLVRNREM